MWHHLCSWIAWYSKVEIVGRALIIWYIALSSQSYLDKWQKGASHGLYKSHKGRGKLVLFFSFKTLLQVEWSCQFQKLDKIPATNFPQNHTDIMILTSFKKTMFTKFRHFQSSVHSAVSFSTNATQISILDGCINSFFSPFTKKTNGNWRTPLGMSILDGGEHLKSFPTASLKIYEISNNVISQQITFYLHFNDSNSWTKLHFKILLIASLSPRMQRDPCHQQKHLESR